MNEIYFPNDPKLFLQEELSIRKKRRPHYSLRAFARDLEMSPSSLCEFLSGRQGMSRERIHWVGNKINLSTIQIEHFCDLVESEFGRTPKDRKLAKVRVATRTKNDQHRLSVEKFHFIADWYNMTLLEILDLPSIEFKSSEISKILNITEEEVKLGIKRLLHLGLIEKKDGRYIVKQDSTVTGDEGPSRAIQIYHEQFLRMQSDFVSKKSVSDRENVSGSIKISQSDWPKIREELKEVTINILTKYTANAKPKDQVLCLALQAITLFDKRES
jgi:uncharacterized protein (TIGR02147 family)